MLRPSPVGVGNEVTFTYTVNNIRDAVSGVTFTDNFSATSPKRHVCVGDDHQRQLRYAGDRRVGAMQPRNLEYHTHRHYRIHGDPDSDAHPGDHYDHGTSALPAPRE